jgi:hypothetical protein
MIIRRISTLLNNIYKSVLQFLYWCIGHDEEQELRGKQAHLDRIAQSDTKHSETEAAPKKSELALEESDRLIEESRIRVGESINAAQELSRKMDALEAALQQHGIYVNQPPGVVNSAMLPVSDNNKQKN